MKFAVTSVTCLQVALDIFQFAPNVHLLLDFLALNNIIFQHNNAKLAGDVNKQEAYTHEESTKDKWTIENISSEMHEIPMAARSQHTTAQTFIAKCHLSTFSKYRFFMRDYELDKFTSDLSIHIKTEYTHTSTRRILFAICRQIAMVKKGTGHFRQ